MSNIIDTEKNLSYMVTEGLGKYIPNFLLEENNNLFKILSSIDNRITELVNYIEKIKKGNNLSFTYTVEGLIGDNVFTLIKNFPMNVVIDEPERSVIERYEYNYMVDGTEEQIEKILGKFLSGATDISESMSVFFQTNPYGEVVYFEDETTATETFLDENDDTTYFYSLYQVSDEMVQIQLSLPSGDQNTRGTKEYWQKEENIVLIYSLLRYIIPKGIIFTLRIV